MEMLWKRKDGTAISRWQEKKGFKICFLFVARINTLRNLRCLNTLGSLLRFLFSFYAKAGCMQCYSVLTVSLKRPVVMPITEVSMKTSTGFIRNRAKRYCVSLQQGQIKKHTLVLGTDFVGSGPSPKLRFSHKILVFSCHKPEVKITLFLT